MENTAQDFRCIQVIPLNSTGELAEVCGAAAAVLTDQGPKCSACLAEFGGEMISEYRPSSLFRIACVLAAADLDKRRSESVISDAVNKVLGGGQ